MVQFFAHQYLPAQAECSESGGQIHLVTMHGQFAINLRAEFT